MNTKINRINKIKTYLRMQAHSSSLTEIHEALSKRMNIDVSRKTIERDIIEMIEKGAIHSEGSIPAKFKLNRPDEFDLILKREEIVQILENLNSSTELYKRLRKIIDTF